MLTRKGANHYPRPGERIAPETLSSVLTEMAPRAWVQGTPAEGVRLCDLDESTWEKLSPAVIGQLAEIIIARVAASSTRKSLRKRHFPHPPDGLTLQQLHLEHRTHLCLAREGFEDDLHSLGDHTIGEVLSMRAFGPRCLVDLLSALEGVLTRGHRLHRGLTQEAERLAELPEAALARHEDPRFAALMDEADPRAPSAKDVAEGLLARSHDPPDPAYVARQIRQLRLQITTMTGWPLEEELIQIFGAASHPRNREILIGYYGWRDGRCHTLAEIGARYGMTRERTRQICAKLLRRKDPAAILAPAMDRTLAFLKERLPCSVAVLEQELLDAGLSKVGLRLEQVEAAARLLGRPIPFHLIPVAAGRLAVPCEDGEIPGAIVEVAKKEIYYHGAATVGQIDEALAERFGRPPGTAIVARTLQLLDGFCWLDQQTGWFRLRAIRKHGLPKTIDKILAVARRIRAPDLVAAVGRNRRVWRTPPPEAMLVEFCRQMPGVRVEPPWVIADPPRDWRAALTGVEAKLVAVLQEYGPIMERGTLEDLCTARGINRFSFHAFLACSPVIAQYGHSVYGLLGAEVSPADLKSLVSRQRTERASTRVLDNHGRTADGRIWLSYRLSKAASTYAVITVPAALKGLVYGKFDLLSGDGRRVGTLAAKDGRAWGLGAFLRRCGARRDDFVTLTLDLEKRQAVVAMSRSG